MIFLAKGKIRLVELGPFGFHFGSLFSNAFRHFIMVHFDLGNSGWLLMLSSLVNLWTIRCKTYSRYEAECTLPVVELLQCALDFQLVESFFAKRIFDFIHSWLFFCDSCRMWFALVPAIIRSLICCFPNDVATRNALPVKMHWAQWIILTLGCSLTKWLVEFLTKIVKFQPKSSFNFSPECQISIKNSHISGQNSQPNIRQMSANSWQISTINSQITCRKSPISTQNCQSSC